jgi:hypothetical protein
MKFTFIRFLGSLGLPTGVSQAAGKVAIRLADIVEKELLKRRVGDESKTDYLQHFIDVKAGKK